MENVKNYRCNIYTKKLWRQGKHEKALSPSWSIKKNDILKSYKKQD